MAKQRRPWMAASGEKPASATTGKPVRDKRPDVELTYELLVEICDRLANGESLKHICEEPKYPSRPTVNKMCWRNPDWRTMLEEAKQIGLYVGIDDMIDIADDQRGDFLLDKDGKPQPIWENVQRSKLRIEARRMRAQMLDPQRFGPKVEQTIVGDQKRPIMLDRPRTAVEVQAEVLRLLAENETEIGLTSQSTLAPSERLRNILLTGKPLTPELYQITYDAPDKKFQ